MNSSYNQEMNITHTFRCTLLLLLLSTTHLIGQERRHVLAADTTWSKEIIPFPIHFAPEIKWEGYEDAQFFPGWGKQESPEFWSYMFSWNINETISLTPNELENYLEFYFDGLMAIVNKDIGKVLPPTNAVLLDGSLKEENSTSIGKIKVYDSFRTKKVITLNVMTNTHNCPEQQGTIIVFRFSPQDFDHRVWTQLKAVGFLNDACDFMKDSK